jgi:hypothetical protein
MKRMCGGGAAPGAAVRALSILGLLLSAGCNGLPGPDPAASGALGEARQPLGQCVTFQRGVNGDVADTLIDADAATTNYGSAAASRVSKTEEALFAVDLSSIPAGATVTGASLSLYVDGDTDKSPVNFHAITAAWSEGTVTYQGFAQQYAAAVSGSFTVTKGGVYEPVDLTALAQAWVSGQTPNHGVLAETAPSSKSAAALFASSESDPSTRPSLAVCYQAAVDRCAGVTCAPLDACHAAGTCDPATGACVAGPPALTTVTGNYTLVDAADAAALACVGAVTGTLTVAGDASVPAVSLPYLQSVGGLTVTPASLTGTLSLGGLTTSGRIVVEENAALTAVGLGALVSADSVAFASDANLASLDLSSLQSVAVDLDVSGTAIASLGPTGLSNLVSVGRNLQVVDNPSLATLGPTSLAQLTAVGSPLEGGVLTVEGEPLLTGIDAGNAVLDGFWLSGNDALTSFHPGPLPANVQYAIISGSPLLADLGPTGLSPIQTVVVDLQITGTAVTSLGPTGLSNLVSVGRNLQVVDNPSLTTLGPTSLAQLTAVGSPSEGGVLTIEGEPLLTGIDAGNAVLNGFWLSGNDALTSFHPGPLPANVQYAIISGSPLLADLGPTGLSPIQSVVVDLQITGTVVTSLGPTGLSNLVSVGRNLQVVDNPYLATLGPTSLAQLTAVGSPSEGGVLTIEGEPLLTGIDASNAVLNGFWLSGNDALASFRLGSLPANVQYAIITGSPLLTDLGPTGLSPIQTVVVDMQISGTAVASLGPTGLSNLVSVGRNLHVSENPQLATLGPAGLSQLVTVGSAASGGSLTLQSDPLLASADLSALTGVTGNLVVDDDAALGTLLLGSLTYLGGNLQIIDDPALPTCFGGLLGQLVGFTGTVNTSGDGPACL